MKAEVRMHDLFDSSYDRLEGSVKQRVVDFIMKIQRDPEAPGLDYKIPKLAQNNRVRTARVTDHYRAVLVVAGEDDGTAILYLVAVKKHDAAYDYASKLTLQVNAKTGAAELFDAIALEEAVDKARNAEPAEPSAKPIMPAKVKQKDLERFGVEPEIAEQLKKVTDEDDLMAIADALPSSQGNAVLDLAYGKSPDEVWADLVIEDPGEVDVDDLDAALQRPLSRLSFTTYDGDNEEELRAVLEGDFAKWRVWLHPLQRKLAQHTGWNGPFRVTGGAGTGKTVTAIHRARHLARRLEAHSSSQKVLFTTFTKNLSRTIEAQLKQLAGPTIGDRVDVVNIDSLARRVVNASDERRKAVSSVKFVQADSAEVRELWSSASLVAVGQWDTGFLADEWSQVVLGNAIVDEAGYLRVTRSGRSQRLTRPQRADVWQVIEQFERLMRSQGLMTFTQLAAQAAALLVADPSLREQLGYRHAVIDEAQDLHPAHWKLLRALIAPGTDDLFIVGDAHQRIYGRPAPLSRYGIETRGRSRRLTINYRTSKEILKWCLQVVDQDVDDLDLASDTLAGARSVFGGPDPEAEQFKSQSDEDKGIAAQINAWTKEGFALSDVAVFAFDNKAVGEIAESLDASGIACVVVTDKSDEDKLGDAVRVMTMHRAKGLEFRAVILARLGADNFPPYYVQKMTGPERELEENKLRNVLYVAGSRARERLAVVWTKELSTLVNASL
ncbi:3'-5' exonuclease [Rhodococcus sp. PvR099]|uniref:3'-5' exonuclease n=1 Tax=Rhodococcus sp. PvR099 TaxID=2806602 RepID=UPI001B63C6D0|nr:3'-5' exonuclease [Rhodococcus sp. PvR099]MBP1159808.1 superfamily I DNA/RNA helicase/mRNA-degrading endonuclease RelE of RelBE toxin-antitoxin system [Rhodococcus sp. PvR099]